MAIEYWKWPESQWVSTESKRSKSSDAVAGVDVGGVSSQAVLMCDGQVYSYASIRTLPGSAESAQSALQKALKESGLQAGDIKYCVATGYGRKNVTFAQEEANEIVCHARGARYMFGPSVMTVCDLGGQAAKAVKLQKWDKIADIMAHDKCATGMGRSVEVMADLMQVPIAEMGERSLLAVKDPEPVSTTCYAFADTEAIGLLREGYKESEVLAAFLFAIACRLHTMIGRLNPVAEIAFTGGLAKNKGIVTRLEKLLGMKALESRFDPQLAGAIGAALIAESKLKQQR